VIDLASGSVRVIPDSNRIIPRQLAFAGDDLLVLDTRRLLVYDDAQTLLREHLLPSDAMTFDVSAPVAAVAMTNGTAALRYLAELPQPETPFANSFYTKMATAKDRVYLFDDEGIDIFSTFTVTAPRYVTGVPTAGAIDLAATNAGLFTLTANGTVTAYSTAGVQVAQTSISEGPTSQALSIYAVRDALWVSLATGCTSAGCRDRKTLVLDPQTLSVATTMNGSIRDVSVDGTRAYALVAGPDEMRVLSISDALHPSQVIAAAAPQSATSIASSNGKVHVLAGKVFIYAEATLTLLEERLTNVAIHASQRIRIEGTCAIVGRESGAPLLYNLPTWTLAPQQFPMPSAIRTFAAQPSLLHFLTDHSLELAYPPPTAAPPRRRAVR
jgi:hypothetical protein